MNRNEIRDKEGKFKAGEMEYLRRRGSVPIITGIYKITNPLGEIYIGGSRTIYRRWLRHREARKKIKIHLSIKEYGWRSHTFEVVHLLPTDVSSEILLTYEQLYIDLYKDCNCTMLNVKDAGSRAKFSEESKTRMSIAQKNRKNETWNKGRKGQQVAWNKGLHLPTKRYIFLYNNEAVEIDDLKTYCKANSLMYEALLSIHNNTNNFYGNKNYYKGYSRVGI